MEQIEYQPDERPAKPGPRLIYIPGYGYIEAPRHLWRYVALVLVVLLTPPAGLWLFLRNFNADAYKPMIAAVIRQAIGRDVQINGPIKLVGSFNPRLVLGPVTLARAPGMTSTAAQIDQVEAQLSLWGLLSGAPRIDRMIVDRPDIQIETGPDAAQSAAPVRTGATTAATVPPAIADLQSVQIRDGRVRWHDARTRADITLNFKRMLVAINDDGGLSVSSEVVLGRERVLISGELGSIARLITPDPAAPWPVSLKAQARGANLAVQGGIARPWELSGYHLQVNGFLLESRNFSAYLPKDMPGLRKVALSLLLTDRGGGVPDLSALSLVVGASDLTPLMPGSRLDALEIHAGGMDQALRVQTRGVLSGSALKMGLVLGTPAGLLQAAAALGLLPAIAPRASVGFPIDLVAHLGGSEITANGALADPVKLSGLDLRLSAALRDATDLERLFRMRLPDWNEARLRTQLVDMPGGLRAGVVLRDLAMVVPAGDLTGAATLRFGDRLTAQATLASQSFDFDVLNSSLAHVHFGPAPGLPPPAPPGMGRVAQMFSQAPFALAAFDYGDLDLDLKMAAVRIGEVPYANAGARVAALAGRVSVERLIATPPGGGVINARFDIDTRAPAPPMRLTVHAPELAIKPILLAMNRAEDIVGSLAVDIDLTAAGRDPHSVVSSLRGRVGLALVDGELDTSFFNGYIFAALRLAKWPISLMRAATGPSRTRCFAAALLADHGQVMLQSLVLDSNRLLIQAEGGLLAESELIDIRIRPQLRLLGQGLAIPMRLAGRFTDAHMLLDTRAATTAFDTAAQSGQRGADTCPDALKSARFGAPGPMPSSPPSKLDPMPTPKPGMNG